MYSYEPIPRDSHKSFYGKCRLYVENGSCALVSYRTVVMTRDENGELHRHWNGWSATTARHIRATFDVSTKEYRQMSIEQLPPIWADLQTIL